MSDGGRYYTECDPDALLMRPLDGLTLIYHRPSGSTHIVDSPVPEILSLLGPAPQMAGNLLERLSADYDLGSREEALSGLEEHLDSLCALGLVRAA